jgi:hypothetical protein
METILRWTSVMCLMLVTGCWLEGPIPSRPKHDEPGANTSPQPNGTAANSAGERKTPEKAVGSGAMTLSTSFVSTGPRPTPEKAAGSGAGPEKAAPEQTSGMVREKAAVGVGEKGRGYGGGMVTQSVHTLFVAKEKIFLEQMRHAQDLYKATEGHSPRTQEEFMDKIIKANNLKLPTLPPGERYVYDPDKDDLMVERPTAP